MAIQTEKDATTMKIRATTELEQTKAKYAALVQECQAEQANLKAIEVQRQHDYEMKKATAFQVMSSGYKTKIVMSGQSGESLIKKLFDTE